MHPTWGVPIYQTQALPPGTATPPLTGVPVPNPGGNTPPLTGAPVTNPSGNTPPGDFPGMPVTGGNQPGVGLTWGGVYQKFASIIPRDPTTLARFTRQDWYNLLNQTGMTDKNQMWGMAGRLVGKTYVPGGTEFENIGRYGPIEPYTGEVPIVPVTGVTPVITPPPADLDPTKPVGYVPKPAPYTTAPLPYQLNPIVYDSLDPTGRMLLQGAVESGHTPAGAYNWEDYLNQFNRSRPMGQHTQGVETMFGAPQSQYGGQDIASGYTAYGFGPRDTSRFGQVGY